MHNIVTYVPKPGKEAELLALVKRHEPALRSVGLVTSEPFRVWKAFDIRKKRVQFVDLRVLEDAGLLQQEKRGRSRVYSVDKARLSLVSEWLGWFESPPSIDDGDSGA